MQLENARFSELYLFNLYQKFLRWHNSINIKIRRRKTWQPKLIWIGKIRMFFFFFFRFLCCTSSSESPDNIWEIFRLDGPFMTITFPAIIIFTPHCAVHVYDYFLRLANKVYEVVFYRSFSHFRKRYSQVTNSNYRLIKIYREDGKLWWLPSSNLLLKLLAQISCSNFRKCFSIALTTLYNFPRKMLRRWKLMQTNLRSCRKKCSSVSNVFHRYLLYTFFCTI